MKTRLPSTVTAFGVLIFAVLCLFAFEKANGSVISEQPQVREKRTVGRGRASQGSSFSQQLADVLESFSSSDSSLSDYAPTTPRPEDVNCYVEIPTTTVIGGRCVSMGGQSYMCQAGAYLALTSQCMNASRPGNRRSNGNLPRRSSAFQMLSRRRNGRN